MYLAYITAVEYISVWNSFIPQSVSLQAHSQFAAQYDIVPALSIYSILLFP